MFRAFRRLASCHCTCIALELRITLWYAREKHFGSKKSFAANTRFSRRERLFFTWFIFRYSSSVEPNGNGSAARYKYLCTSGRRDGARRREGRMGRGREGGRGHHARAACVFCFVSFVVVVVAVRPSGSYVAVRWTLTTGDAVQRRRVRSPR